MFEDDVKKLAAMMKESRAIVFFGGAGVSTESGIPDFRSVDGLYNQKYDYPPETILSHTFFIRKPKEFYRFYMDKLILENVEPNTAHKVLAKLEAEGKMSGVVTQNIDGLHQMAGSRKVYELHGTTFINHCTRCNKRYDIEFMKEFKKSGEDLPLCSCGGLIKPDVVLYEEGLDQSTVDMAISAILNADMMIVAGTSLSVYPAAGLVRYFKGKHIVLINKSATSLDSKADLVLHEKVGVVLGKAYELMHGMD